MPTMTEVTMMHMRLVVELVWVELLQVVVEVVRYSLVRWQHDTIRYSPARHILDRAISTRDLIGQIIVSFFLSGSQQTSMWWST